MTNDTLSDIAGLRDLRWSWTRIAGHYKVSEREVRRWWTERDAPSNLSAPLCLRWGTALVVSDTQFPFIDRAVWEVTCQIARDAEVDTLIWDGDMLDFAALSSFKHNPYKTKTADQEVGEFHATVRDPFLASHRPAREFWVNGNHEYRYTRYIEHNAGAVGRFDSPRDFLRLPEEVSFTEWGKASGHWLTPKLLVAHGWQASKHSAYTAKANAMDMGSVSVITGHTHRFGMDAHKTHDGTQVAWEVGHMCDPENLPKAVEGHQNWHLVAGTLVRYERGGDAFHVELLPVIGRRENRVLCNATDREYRIR